MMIESSQFSVYNPKISEIRKLQNERDVLFNKATSAESFVNELFENEKQNLESCKSYLEKGGLDKKPAFTLREKVMVLSAKAAKLSVDYNEKNSLPKWAPYCFQGVMLGIVAPFVFFKEVNREEGILFFPIALFLSTAFSAFSLVATVVECVFKAIMFSLYKTLNLFSDSEKLKNFLLQAKVEIDKLTGTTKELKEKDTAISKLKDSVAIGNHLYTSEEIEELGREVEELENEIKDKEDCIKIYKELSEAGKKSLSEITKNQNIFPVRINKSVAVTRKLKKEVLETFLDNRKNLHLLILKNRKDINSAKQVKKALQQKIDASNALFKQIDKDLLTLETESRASSSQ